MRTFTVRSYCAVALGVSCLLLGPTASGQSEPDSLAAREAARVGAVRLAEGLRIRLDGRLDEAAWQDVPVATGFVQSEPVPGAPASERTEVRLVYSDQSLFVGFRCFVRDPATLIGRLTRRDNLPQSDRVFVEIGSPADGRTAFSFGVNLSGVQQDVLLYNDQNDGDFEWDAVWDSAVERFSGPDGEGYSVEIQIPFSQLRYDAASGRPWQIQFQRDIPVTGERTYWAPIRPDREGYVSQFGHVDGLTSLRAPRRVEVVPYAATRLIRAPGDAADPFYAANDVTPALGLDAKVGLTSGITLTATLNPDFGQVEADPAVVNLTQFEVRFEERRPFFVEGTDVFAYGGTRGRAASDRPQFFYSRRIGGEPSAFRSLYADTAYSWLESPDQTTIAGAAKVSGQLAGWTFGLLDAVTAEERARFITPAGDRQSLPVAPFANYLVGRAQRAWQGGRTLAGAFVSSVVRDTRTAAFGAVLPSDASVLGLDGEIATPSRSWTLSGVLSGSLVRGEAGVVTALQRAPQRYFQRTDADYVEVDPAATALSGYRVETALAKTGGRNWRGGLTLGATSPGFEVNDLGFQQRADYLSADWQVEYREPRPTPSWLNYGQVQLFGAEGYTYGGDLIRRNVNLATYGQFANLWSSQVILTYRPVYANDRLTRGGPIALRPADGNLSLFGSTNRAKRLWMSASLAGRTEFAHDFENVGTEWTVLFRPQVGFRPTDALELTLQPEWTSLRNTDQYLGVRSAPGYGIDGRRYLFSDVRVESIELGVRADWAFTPNLTLQLVAVPQVYAADFSDIRELARRDSYDFVRYGGSRGSVTSLDADGRPLPGADPNEAARYAIDPGDGGAPFTLSNVDFTRLSLRGNAVVRWQWRPGSTVFFVWQQIRDERAAYGGLDVLRDVDDALRAEVQNVFLLKATYWFGL